MTLYVILVEDFLTLRRVEFLLFFIIRLLFSLRSSLGLFAAVRFKAVEVSKDLDVLAI